MWPFFNPAMTQNMMQSMMKPWQDMLGQSAMGFPNAFSGMMPNLCTPSRAPVTTNPMQQAMDSWQQLWMPQASASTNAWPSPKVTVMTIELGDMRAYIEPAMAMMNMWQNAGASMTQGKQAAPFYNFWQAGRA